jgi:hypothetical protein
MAKLDENGEKLTTFKKTFINYLSIGYDARVGFGFDKGRCGNRCCNKLLYFWEGCKKNCCRGTIRLNNLIESFKMVTFREGEHLFDGNDCTLLEDKARHQVLFKSKSSIGSVQTEVTVNQKASIYNYNFRSY